MTFFSKFKKLTLRGLDPEDAVSTKRLVLVFSVICFFAQVAINIVLGSIAFMVTTHGNLDVIKVYLEHNEVALQDNFYIILACLGLITGENLGKIMVEKAKVTAPDITVEDGGKSTVVQNADTITPTNTVNAQNVQTINTQTTNTGGGDDQPSVQTEH